MKEISICFLLLITLAASKSIPESYSSNGGQYNSNFAVMYNYPNKGEFGFSGEAGDINNDGLTDFIVADPAYDNNKGIVYVIYGKKGTLRQFSTMNDFTSSDGFIIKGALTEVRLGSALGAAGDVNGDGIDDFILGCYNWRQDNSNLQVGLTYVIFGRKSSSEFPFQLDVDRLSSTQGFKMFGEGANHLAGYSVSGAGDVNGDGISDIIVGAIGWNSWTGRAYVVFGKRSGWEDFKFPPAAGKGFAIDGWSYGEHFGNSVSRIGDFNGDGIDDMVIGAHCGSQWTGRAYVIYGRRDFPTTIKASDGLIMSGAKYGDNFGCSVTDIGDFNGDGLKDIAVGAFEANNNKGATYVILGSRQNPQSLSVNSMSSSRGFYVSSSSASAASQIGLFVSGGRDLNGDGLSDLVVGAPGLNNNKGAVYVLYGYAQYDYVNIMMDSLSSNRGYTLNGLNANDRFGHFVKPLKDVNKDGVSDLLVNAGGSNGGKGILYLLYSPWKCASNCDSCSKPDTCDTCSYGYGFLNGACVTCPSNTHQLSNGYCIKKCSAANCQSCTQPDKCDTCISGYGFLNGACVICPSNTHTLSNGNCVAKCPDFCKSCSKPDTCDVCEEGFGLLGGGCAACPDFFTLSEGKCLQCPLNCQKCATPNTCNSCRSGYGLLNGACVTCPSSTHFLSNGLCLVKCSSNCAQCTTPNTCDTCAQGYGFLGGNCVVCPSTHTLNNGLCKANCAANCEQCSEANKCDVCIQGYGFIDGKCEVCPEETHVLSNGSCFIKCSENCSKCSKPNSCDVCLSGFGFLDDEECSLCPINTHFLNNGFCIEIQDKFKIIKDFFSGLCGR